MLFTLSTLPQLAVSAKLLCLLMVVICGAVSPVVRSLKLYSVSTKNFVRVSDSGGVYAGNNLTSDEYSNLTLSSVDLHGILSIYSEQTQRYICFSKKGRLIGVKDLKRKERLGEYCKFREHMPELYTMYQSMGDAKLFMGFNKQGKPLKARDLRRCSKNRCDFIKKFESNIIDWHNKMVSQQHPMRHYRHHQNFNNNNNRQPEPSVRFRHGRFKG